ncbi:Omp28 family outer membrane lipoprotein [Schleiferia thermophila]|uniref:Outer membrane protein Omp28 n=1 Tax=Schleiferia thermophila TaxID=884107 RepID=A0A369A1N8_9FLAO|nr:Omp28 family outer membrane lipoprotein [Schleiferia thermophila]KFD39378.1 hypothetical protein AT05_05495 [Schleiferia thermophila str. Yellowstone]RCX03212.1 outer membrane protein Omp28 [Schleiferia thermophila]GCD80339.1 hypothetical protein JCM30197_15860 [Schleiferia thermophila]
MRTFLKLIFLASTAVACDYISDPVKSQTGLPGGNQEIKRVVLLEEFTGHQCQNCPDAHSAANVLKDQYGDQLVIVAIHAGNFANVSADYPYDFRTPAGNELFSFFNGFAVPSGMINRMDYSPSRTQLKTFSSWSSLIAEEINKEPDVDIKISKDYNTQNRQLTVTIQVKGLKTQIGNYRLSVFLTESGIIAPQKHGSQRIENYIHNSVLRAALNGTYGEPVFVGGIEINKIETHTYSITLQSEWVAENCELIAFVYDQDSYYVHQAARKYVRQ